MVQTSHLDIQRYSDTRIGIIGWNFGAAMSAVSVVFTPTLSSITKISCNDTLFVVDVGDTNSVTLGDLNAVVTHSTYGSSR